MADCIFCQILAGKIPAQKVYEGEQIVAFLDINPIAPGHVLVVPREHQETWLDLRDGLAATLAMESQRVARAVVKATGADGFNLLMNNDRCAGQAIPHAHFHVVPRRKGDAIKFNWVTKPYPEGEIDKVAGAIRAALK